MSFTTSISGLDAAQEMLSEVNMRLRALEDEAPGSDAVFYLLVKHRKESVGELFDVTDGGEPIPATMTVSAYTVHHRDVADSINASKDAFVLERKMMVRVFGDAAGSTVVTYYTGSDPQDFAVAANAKTVELVRRHVVSSEPFGSEAKYSVLSRYDPCFADAADDTSFCVGCRYLGTHGDSFTIPGPGGGEDSFFVKESDSGLGPVYDALLLFAGLQQSADA